MASVDKVKVSDTTYDVSPSATGTLNGFNSGDSASPSSWSSVDVISTSDTNSSIFNKITTMAKNVRWLYAKLGNDDFSGTGQSTITGALSILQSGLDGKSPLSHTHTVDTLPVSNNQVNSENYVPTSALLYSMVQRANSIADRITVANETINGGGTSGPSGPSDPSVPSDPSIDIGTTWLYEKSGTFEVPITGKYQVEMHGGGSGGSWYLDGSRGYSLVGGGGSGEISTVNLTKGEVISVSIGAGGKSGSPYGDAAISGKGGNTRFGDLTIYGARDATAAAAESSYPGPKSGSIASAGSKRTGVSSGTASGGYGNTGNTAQTYGNGGSATCSSTGASATDGQPGAVIVTFMGVS